MAHWRAAQFLIFRPLPVLGYATTKRAICRINPVPQLPSHRAFTGYPAFIDGNRQNRPLAFSCTPLSSNMAELMAAGTAIGVASSLVTFAEVAWRVLKRL